jgi:urea transport system permease protein
LNILLAILAVVWVVACTVLLVIAIDNRAAAQDTVETDAAADEGGDDAYRAAVLALGEGGFRDKIEAIDGLVALNDPRALPVLSAMLDNRLYVTEEGRLVIAREVRRGTYAITDAATQEDLGTVGGDALDRVRVNNRIRRTLHGAVSQLQIASPDAGVRLSAARQLARDRSPETAALLRQALEREENSEVAEAITLSLARIDLTSDDPQVRLAAIEALSGSFSPDVRALLNRLLRQDGDGSYAEPDPEVRAAAQAAVDRIESNLALVDLGVNIYQGVSLGSVLLLAAIGLAITFGVMGVINMAHGEMLMLGAYTTFVVQELFRTFLPGLFDFYVLAAIPMAFLVAGSVGVGMERGVIRFLYGRPLETLLATWGISLILQQIVRVVFGAPNREVANPDWMTGGIETIGGAVLTYNRLYTILFAILVLIAVMAVIRYSRFGLQMRAVTQNRPMAAAMGIRSGWVDAMTFGLGSGIAGVGGVALSQIGNVSPNLGQAYIVDSFMVVVFGGVGSLWGVLTAAMSLGILNKFLEPVAGAMLGKIIVLVLVILFIQRYPRGLFALKGRAAEA